eukprot:TRINITY_DN38753_c0_g1_i1.p1 TRINITY_DN38753_c0_g1~~TRINITY_DN38753_c0_g1_i1.p1  ORF type:complete len:156 (+),score=29.14 TRINITY_DN38753_c0_g1_i1:36-503(+)
MTHFVPGVRDIPNKPANEWKVLLQPESLPPHGVYRECTLFSSLTSALDHVASKQYGENYDVAMTPLLRHEIEAAFDKAIALAFGAVNKHSSGFVDISAEPSKPNSTFPLYRCTRDNTWTLVMKDVKITLAENEASPVRQTINVDNLVVQLAQGRP